MVSLINIVQHFVSDVVAEASKYGKSYSKVYALLNNVTNIANQLPNMAALYVTVYVKTKYTGVNKTYRPNRIKQALDWLQINSLS